MRQGLRVGADGMVPGVSFLARGRVWFPSGSRIGLLVVGDHPDKPGDDENMSRVMTKT